MNAGKFRVTSLVAVGIMAACLFLTGCNKKEADKGASMEIKNGSTVSIDYKLTVDGKVVDQSKEGQPLSYVQGSQQIISGLEEALAGLKKGDKKSVSISPEKGYGVRDDKALQKVPASAFGDDSGKLKVGEVVSGKVNGQEFQAVIAKMDKDFVTLDLNHPLAGKTLNFDVEIVNVQ